LFKAAKKAESKIVTPRLGCTYKETYCVLTLRIMQMTKILLMLIAFIHLVKAISTVIGNKYGPWIAST
jgi:hypothetical protein